MNRVALFLAGLFLVCSMSGCCLLGYGYGSGYYPGGYGGGGCGSCGGCATGGYPGAQLPGGPTAFAPGTTTAFAPSYSYPTVAVDALPTYQ